MAGPSQVVFGVCFGLVALYSTLKSNPTPEELRSAVIASQAAIITLQAHVKIKIEFNPARASISKDRPTVIHYEIDYTRAGAKERHKEQGHLGVRDILLEDGKGGSKLLLKRGANQVSQALISATDEFTPYVDVWSFALFKLPWCKKPLGQLLVDGTIESVKFGTDAKQSLIVLVVHDSRGRYEITIDQSVNSLVRRFIADCNVPNGSARMEYEVHSFREVQPGVFFPERMGHTLIANGAWFEKSDIDLTNILVNEKLPHDAFRQLFPPGTRVTDGAKSLFYVIGNDSRPGKVEPLVIRPGPPHSLPPGPPATSTPALADDNWPLHRFLLLLSAGAVVLGLGLMIRRRRR